MTASVHLVDFGEPFGGILPGSRGAVLSVLLRTSTPLTGRQIHRLLADSYSLWSIQEALKVLASLGLVETTEVGRAGVHAINEDHVAVAPLRALVDPVAALTGVIRSAVDDHVEGVILFGSVARGEASTDSDVDLAIIARPGWDGRAELAEAVHNGLGNTCDVLVFTHAEFEERARDGEPVVADILRDGVALLGVMPRIPRRPSTRGAA